MLVLLCSPFPKSSPQEERPHSSPLPCPLSRECLFGRNGSQPSLFIISLVTQGHWNVQFAGHGSNTQGAAWASSLWPRHQNPRSSNENIWAPLSRLSFLREQTRGAGIFHLSLIHWFWMGVMEAPSHIGVAEKFNETYEELFDLHSIRYYYITIIAATTIFWTLIMC